MSEPAAAPSASGLPVGASPPADRYFRKGLGLRTEVKEHIAGDYHSEIVRRFREEGFTLRVGDVTFRLAREFGFCYGVDRAVDYAYQTLEKFPDKRVILTGRDHPQPRRQRAPAVEGRAVPRRPRRALPARRSARATSSCCPPSA